MSRRRGFTLAELMISMVILGIVGTGLISVLVSETRFFSQQTEQREARMVSGAAVNAALSDLRMVEGTGGTVAATSKSVTVRAPYAMGIVCANSLTQTTVALFPFDSTQYTNAGFSGYAWRDSVGNYNYVEIGSAVGSADSAATCAAAGVSVVPGGGVVTVTPPMPSTYPTVTTIGTPVFLFQRLTYAFQASTTLTGRTGLWRTVVATSQSAELVAPFDSSARFLFYSLGSSTPDTAVPSPLSNLRGLQLDLKGQSERAPEGSSTQESAEVITAVFFNNLLK
jgi:prepilin-type N-terminal cleavage/methylation domain-containing protein